MNEENKVTIPYIVYESSMARMERQLKRLVIALIVSIGVIFLTNVLWIYLWNSYEYVGESTVTVEGEGNANYIGNDGDITNGESDSKENKIP